MKTTFNEFLNENTTLSSEWTYDIVEYLQGYYGITPDYKKLFKLIKEVVDMAVNAKSFNSFNDFIGSHNSKYWEKNKIGNYKNLWWGTISYLLNNTDNIIKDEIDEKFMLRVISIMDNVIDERQENN
jgi:hypothetical protein